jgi:5-methylcytosine-specific restriction endonuclease McrA
MSLSVVRPRASVLPSRPVSEPSSIRNLMGDYGSQVELRPVYQRDIRWKKDNMCDLIKTIMSEGLIPGLILYKLQGEERSADSPYRYEMVDGQHRFFTIQKFFNSELVTEAGGKPFLISWIYRDASTGRDVHIFYKENDATKEWAAQHRIPFSYMTEEEKDAFNSFKIDVKEIKDPLTLDQRRAIFVSLQQGVSVRGSDLLKNKVEVRLVRFIVEEARWESKMKEVLAARCHMNPKNYWLHWVIRFFLILNPLDKLEEEKFAIRDADLTKMIKDGSDYLMSDEEEEEQLQVAVERFFAFLDSLPVGVRLPPVHFYALFTHLASAEDGREDLLRGHIAEWANNAHTKAWKKAWENRKNGDDDGARAEQFARCVDQLERIKAPALPPGTRTSIPKKLRLKVYRNAFGSEADCGFCYCCGDLITYDEDYEACHVIASKNGGSDTFENLRPGCRSCNRSMGTQDMREFKAQFYPDAETPLSEEC